MCGGSGLLKCVWGEWPRNVCGGGSGLLMCVGGEWHRNATNVVMVVVLVHLKTNQLFDVFIDSCSNCLDAE